MFAFVSATITNHQVYSLANISLRKRAYYSCLLSYCNLANTFDDSKSPILKLASYFIIMVRGMDQSSISEEVGCDSSNEIWPGVGQLLKILQIMVYFVSF